MRVCGYVRVSTLDQSETGVSIAAQREKIAAFCRLHELDLIGIDADPGVSASTLKRPGLETALGRLDRGEAAGLVVAKLDRISRSVADFDALIRGYFGPDGGKQLFSVADSIDTRTAAGRMVLNILMSVAQWEREAIVERTRDAIGHKRALGERIGRIPFGFGLAPDAKTLIEDGTEQAILDRIREWHADGIGAREIARRLDIAEVPTRSGRPWQHSTIRAILDRRAAG